MDAGPAESQPIQSELPKYLCALENETLLQQQIREDGLVLRVFIDGNMSGEARDFQNKILRIICGRDRQVRLQYKGWQILFEHVTEPELADIEVEHIKETPACQTSKARLPRPKPSTSLPLLYVILPFKLTRNERRTACTWKTPHEVYFSPTNDDQILEAIVETVSATCALTCSLEKLIKSKGTQGLGTLFQTTLKMYHYPTCLQENDNLLFEALQCGWAPEFISYLSDHGAQLPEDDKDKLIQIVEYCAPDFIKQVENHHSFTRKNFDFMNLFFKIIVMEPSLVTHVLSLTLSYATLAWTKQLVDRGADLNSIGIKQRFNHLLQNPASDPTTHFLLEQGFDTEGNNPPYDYLLTAINSHHPILDSYVPPFPFSSFFCFSKPVQALHPRLPTLLNPFHVVGTWMNMVVLDFSQVPTPSQPRLTNGDFFFLG